MVGRLGKSHTNRHPECHTTIVILGQGLQTGEGGHRGNSSSPDEFRMALIVLESHVTNNNNNDLRRLGLTRTPKICRGVSSHNITYISKE